MLSSYKSFACSSSLTIGNEMLETQKRKSFDESNANLISTAHLAVGELL